MTGESPSNPRSLDRYREASEWLLRLTNAAPTDADVDRWLSWCEADADNLAAFETVQRDWHDLEGLRNAPELIVCDENRAGVRQREFRAWTASRFSRPSIVWALAASLIGIVIIGYWRSFESPRTPQMVTAAQRGPTTLPDGSSLLLSAKATAEVNFNGADRDVTLRPGGEAYIKVHHDKSWPFVVRAGSVTITAVGTAFDVRRDTGHVIVTVEEGVVALGAPAPNGPTEWRAGAGYQVDYSEKSRTAVVSSVDPDSVLQWRYGELAYDGTPLRAVIADVNRYSNVHVIIRDPLVGQLPYTGTVFVASIHDWLSALAVKYPVKAGELAPNVIALSSATSDVAPTTR